MTDLERLNELYQKGQVTSIMHLAERVIFELNAARAQLAERDALLRECLEYLNASRDVALKQNLRQRIEAALGKG